MLRREFLWVGGGAALAGKPASVLVHEHVLVDFVGADQIRPGRYDRGEVIRIALPKLEEVRKLGCRRLLECTPNFLGRDPELLARLDVEWVLPSHGQAFRDHTVRIEFLLEHSRRMAAQICSLRAGGIESPHDLARAFWKRPMNAFEHRNAVFEMLAYLQHPD